MAGVARLGPDVTTPEGIAEGNNLRAAGWADLEVVTDYGPLAGMFGPATQRLWICPTCSALVLSPALHKEVLPHP